MIEIVLNLTIIFNDLFLTKWVFLETELRLRERSTFFHSLSSYWEYSNYVIQRRNAIKFQRKKMDVYYLSLDELSVESRDFFERAKLKFSFSIFLGATRWIKPRILLLKLINRFFLPKKVWCFLDFVLRLVAKLSFFKMKVKYQDSHVSFNFWFNST